MAKSKSKRAKVAAKKNAVSNITTSTPAKENAAPSTTSAAPAKENRDTTTTAPAFEQRALALSRILRGHDDYDSVLAAFKAEFEAHVEHYLECRAQRLARLHAKLSPASKYDIFGGYFAASLSGRFGDQC